MKNYLPDPMGHGPYLLDHKYSSLYSCKVPLLFHLMLFTLVVTLLDTKTRIQTFF